MNTADLTSIFSTGVEVRILEGSEIKLLVTFETSVTFDEASIGDCFPRLDRNRLLDIYR